MSGTAVSISCSSGDDAALALGFGTEQQQLVVTGRLHVERDHGHGGAGPVANGFTGLEGWNIDYVLRFALRGSVTGTDNNRVRYRTYFTTPTTIAFPGLERTAIGVLAHKLSGNCVSLQLKEVPGKRRYTVQLSLNDMHHGAWVSFDVQPSTVHARLDASGFPALVCQSENFLLTHRVFLERYVQDALDTFQLQGRLVANGEMYLRVP